MLSGSHRQQEDAIMRSVVHLLRGLSALFWGLPLVLLAEARGPQAGLRSTPIAARPSLQPHHGRAR